MKSKLLIRTVFSVGFLTLLMASAGCETERLKAENRRLAENYELADAKNQSLEAEIKRLEAELKYQSTNPGLTAENARLKADNQKKADALLKLKAMYDQAVKRPGRPLPEKLNSALEQFAQANPQLIEFDAKYGMVKFKSDLTFPPGGTTVTPKAKETLGKLVQILNSPAAGEFAVYVAGHTDDMKIKKASTKRRHPNNWYLSVHRAVIVQDVLEEFKLSAKRIAVVGFGEHHPVAPNAPKNKGSVKNRRVEIWIVPAGQFLTVDAK